MAEVRVGTAEVAVYDDELGFELVIGEIVLTEVQMVDRLPRATSSRRRSSHSVTA